MYFVEHQGANLLNEAINLRVIDKSGADASQLLHLREASKHQQLIIVKTEKDEPLASIAFAKISKFTLRYISKNSEHKLLSYEYNEGKILFVLDGFFRSHYFKESFKLLLPKIKKYRLIAYVKRGKLRVFYNDSGAIRPVKL